ncbi:MAG: hypothetical protein HDT44_03165 [Ruminococcaceae bacterium]|nr:hypothetical protein [Oscillospiraceae bacterium]
MSLKSFDKFCEDMILGKGGSEKEIFDERQNQVRTKLTIEALVVYIASVLVNSFIMEMFYQWCESFCIPMVLLAAICYLYWIVRNAVKGSLFGVKGTRSAKYTAFILMLESFLFAFKYIFPILESEQGYFFSEGKATNDFICAITFVVIFISGIMIFALAKKYDKKMQE